jgi:hypothetical protein
VRNVAGARVVERLSGAAAITKMKGRDRVWRKDKNKVGRSNKLGDWRAAAERRDKSRSDGQGPGRAADSSGLRRAGRKKKRKKEKRRD